MASTQYTFFGDHKALESLSQLGDRLEEFNKILDIKPLVAVADKIWRGRPLLSTRGRKPWDSELMLRVLLLKRFYNLSDEDMEYQLRDRISFMRFAGLGLGDNAPDARSIWLYAEQLAKEDGARELFEEFNKQLRDKGVMVKEGMMIDATFVPVPVQRNSREESRIIKEGGVPAGWERQPAKLAHKDVDARWTKKNEVSCHGYKNHTKTGAKTKLTHEYKGTAASVHDSQAAPELIKSGDVSVHADSAYTGAVIEADLREKKVEGYINEKASRGQALSEEQKKNNRIKSKTRARVEHPFAFMEKSLGGIYNRCIGKVRNLYQIGMMNLAYNMWRAVFLLKQAAKQGDGVPRQV